ncbi:MAG TPA: rod shape-determining protein RodA [Acidimicrobiales bacterium]|jgi:rod shape determining protein RodA|nr:rod shape-determining protein RodA [Acidimicrobiales bacterium]
MATASATSVFPLRKGATAAWRHIDLALLASAVAIAGLGVLMVFSATESKLREQGLDPHMYLKRQSVWVLLGLAVMAVAVTVDYRVLRDIAPMLFIGAFFLLVLVLSPLGSSTRGAQAWFQFGSFQLEPSEWAKLALIACVAAYCSTHRGDLDGRRLATVLGLAGAPMALIYLQPDLGTDLVFAAILIGVLVVAGARPRHIAALCLIAIVGMVAVVQLGVLKQYQVDRLTAFANPTNDPQHSAYNLAQAKAAIGSGGLFGKGLFKGTQTNLSFVPEQQTDFIFTVVGEELGFVGAFTLLALFAVVVWRTWRTATLARDLFGTLLCVGILAMFVFQIFENVGMTMGIMPITGIPLPFMSYGGSSTVANFAAIGLVLNVHMRRFA